MREIKFRAWCKKHKLMYDVCSLQFTGKKVGANDNKSCLGNEIIMQYTGLKDMNGKEIYESDYVKVFDVSTGINSEGYVTFGNGSFYITDEVYSRYRWIDYQVEVIGNIYENPELFGY